MDYSDCVLPFEYNGKTYTNCTSIDRKYHWCSLTKSFEGAWKYCIGRICLNLHVKFKKSLIREKL